MYEFCLYISCKILKLMIYQNQKVDEFDDSGKINIYKYKMNIYLII